MKNTVHTIQVARTLAALSVVYAHIGTKFHFGVFGVDMFFVISGFVITSVIEKNPNPIIFILNRLVRIAPLYWITSSIMMIISLTYSSKILRINDYSINNFVLSIFFIPFERQSDEIVPILPVGWSLNYEMYFYLMAFLVLILIKKYREIIIMLTIFLLTLFFRQISDLNTISLFLGDFIVFEFIFGIIIFKLYKFGWIERLNHIYCSFSIVFFYLLMVYFDYIKFSGDRLILFGMPSFILIISILRFESLISIKNIFIRTLSSLGDSTYSIYLTHIFLIEFTRRIFALNEWNFMDTSIIFTLVLMVFCVLVGVLFNVLLDRPIRVSLISLVNKKVKKTYN